MILFYIYIVEYYSPLFLPIKLYKNDFLLNSIK